MFDLGNYLDLPLVWAFLIGTAIFLYVLLDGFDLGIGIIFPFAPSNECRDRMMNSIAPFWDGNETWLILGGGGLFAAFPLAYSILMPAFYIPIIIMLLGLILRGVAFEFRFKTDPSHRYIWDMIFHVGSLTASFCQGMILGSFVQGVMVDERNFAGGPFDWANGFSIMAGIGVVFGYALIGSTWLVMKTDKITHDWGRRVAIYVLFYVCVFVALVSISMPFVEKEIAEFWFSLPNFYYLLPIPLATLCCFIALFYILFYTKNDTLPFLITIAIFFLSYLGLALSIFPWIIPFKYTIWQAAASSPSLSLLIIGVAPTLPLILFYTGYCYYVFRGKVSHESLY